jgi:hypothetical protein
MNYRKSSTRLLQDNVIRSNVSDYHNEINEFAVNNQSIGNFPDDTKYLDIPLPRSRESRAFSLIEERP